MARDTRKIREQGQVPCRRWIIQRCKKLGFTKKSSNLWHSASGDQFSDFP